MKWLVGFLPAFVALSAWAGSFEEFKKSSTVIVDRLIELGLDEKIQSLDLKKLRKEIKRTNWIVVTKGFMLGSGEDRATSICLAKQRKIFVNEMALDFIDSALFPVISLHEALCANGYNDEKSQISLVLEQLSQTPDRILLLQKFAKPSEAQKLENTLAMVLNSSIEPDWKQTHEPYVKVESLDGATFRVEIPSVQWALFNFDQINGNRRKQSLAEAILAELITRFPQ